VADFTCTLGTPQKQTQKRHRVVQFMGYDGKLISVITSLSTVTAEEVADMYKSRWAIESFFRWVKQNLNVPVLFGTTENAVFNQLFAALIAFVLLKFIHKESGKEIGCKRLSFASFHRLLLCDDLSIEWRLSIKSIMAWNQRLHMRGAG